MSLLIVHVSSYSNSTISSLWERGEREREREREREGFSLDLSDRHERGKCYSVRFEKSKARNIGHAWNIGHPKPTSFLNFLVSTTFVLYFVLRLEEKNFHHRDKRQKSLIIPWQHDQEKIFWRPNHMCCPSNDTK